MGEGRRRTARGPGPEGAGRREKGCLGDVEAGVRGRLQEIVSEPPERHTSAE